MKDHVTNLEISQRFKEAGIEKKGKFAWLLDTEELIPEWVLIPTWLSEGIEEKKEHYPAYLLSELLDMVEGRVKLMYHPECKWGFFSHEDDKIIGKGETAIEAVAEAILWQKEQEK